MQTKSPKIDKSYANSNLLWSTLVLCLESGIPAQLQQSLHRPQVPAKLSSEERGSPKCTLKHKTITRENSLHYTLSVFLTTRVWLYL